MLVLSRKVNESFVINGVITVKVLSRSGRCVKLGIEAPDDVSIVREEIHRLLAAEEEAEAKQIPAAARVAACDTPSH